MYIKTIEYKLKEKRIRWSDGYCMHNTLYIRRAHQNTKYIEDRYKILMFHRLNAKVCAVIDFVATIYRMLCLSMPTKLL